MSETTAEQPEKIGDLMNKLRTLKLRKENLGRQLDAVDKEFKDTKTEMISALREQGQEMTRVNGLGTASISSKVVPSATDWEAFHEWIVANNAPALLQRRINQSAYAELRNRGEEIPGVQDFELEDLNLRITRD